MRKEEEKEEEFHEDEAERSERKRKTIATYKFRKAVIVNNGAEGLFFRPFRRKVTAERGQRQTRTNMSLYGLWIVGAPG